MGDNATTDDEKLNEQKTEGQTTEVSETITKKENVIVLTEVEKLTEQERIALRKSKFKTDEEIALESRQLRFYGEVQQVVTPSDREKRFANDNAKSGAVLSSFSSNEQLQKRAERFGELLFLFYLFFLLFIYFNE